MKQAIFFLLALAFVSCKQEESSSPLETVETVEERSPFVGSCIYQTTQDKGSEEILLHMRDSFGNERVFKVKILEEIPKDSFITLELE